MSAYNQYAQKGNMPYDNSRGGAIIAARDGGNMRRPIDIHEEVKRQLYSQQIGADYSNFVLGQVSKVGFGGGLTGEVPTNNNNTIGFVTYVARFDSLDTKLSSDLANGEISFNVADYTGNTLDIRDCVAIHLSQFYFPRPIVPANSPDLLYDRRIYLRFLNLPITESAQAGVQKPYHFELKISSPNSLAVACEPSLPSFYFKTAITSISELRMGFMHRTELDKLPIPEARINLISVANSNPAQFDLVSGDATKIIGNIGPLAPTYVAIRIKDFASANVTLNNAINANNGIYITDVISATRIQLSGYSFAGIPAISATAIVEQNKISIQLQFVCLRQAVTNNVPFVQV